ncbi:N-acetylmuramoyl-L-alanine amidase [Mesonia phycicola]|uniref:N-acetylmuramoyl-L-alanine amidase n=1 Tax=Mesonia phycicola TaxID=579105 RepID=A0A1M6A5K7_9FLAO|nr:N-acetylmuramoyl-L-alanine amidase [Mesonia phycicola]SHI31679.1 N-acetylmuramoyl-L-alanine amidase [Mesonia phycicola]
MKNTIKILLLVCSVSLFAFTTPPTEKTIKIVIDAGHGGKDAGSYSEEISESQIVFNITQKIKELHQDKNVEIYFTRDNNEFISLEERVEFINNIKPDLVLSLHTNASNNTTNTGFEIYFTKNNKFKDQNYNFASKLASHLAFQNTSLGKVSIKNANFKIIKDSNAPALLIELGFLSNPDEKHFLNSEEGQLEIANTILTFIEK